jgi:hypothetical protein
MENIIILLACVVMTTATGNYKLFKMEKTEKVEVREFEMRTKELDKTLSRKLHIAAPEPPIGSPPLPYDFADAIFNCLDV